jgi:6-phosphofructokinase 1
VIGLRGNRISKSPLLECVSKTHEVADAIATGDYDRAMELRGGSFRESWRTFHTLARSLPHPPKPGQRRLRLAVLHAGAPSPGMNTAVRVAVRIGVDQGHILLGVHNGFQGLIDNLIQEMDWQSVAGLASRGGAELGTNRRRPETEADFNAIAHNLERNDIEGLLVIGGWSGYEAAYRLWERRKDYPAFDIPVICLPASIDNNLPGSELSIGIDTALNSIMEAVDKIKQSAVASNRVFVIEVMGLYCGYLALMSGLATGAERVYLHEEGVTLRDLQADVENLKAGFARGKRLGLLIRNECANPTYDTHFMCALFTEEGKGLFSVRKAILGHIQQGGDPTPFDRIQSSRLANRAIQWLIDKAGQDRTDAAFIGLEKGDIQLHNLQDLPVLGDMQNQRPAEQWWMELRGIARVLAQSGPRR